MRWIPMSEKRPTLFKPVWISYIVNGIITSQEQTYAKIVGKNRHGPIWVDMIAGNFFDNNKYKITHWMPIPDNPILVQNS